MFELPGGNVQIAFSGGRTSAYMLRRILDAHGGTLPDRCIVSFQNTGREMPQTLDFVAEVGARWGVPIVWLEYRPTKPLFEVVNHNSASRNGEPFEALIERLKFLPNVVTRYCTVELKIRTAKRYLMAMGWRRWTVVTGIRADEMQRLANPDTKQRWKVIAPLAQAGITKRDVAAFWAEQPFDLRLPNIKGKSWLGNCDGCFMKAEAHLAALAKQYPERAAWWEEQERRVGEVARKPDAAFFSKRYSRRELREFMDRQGDLALSIDGVLCQRDEGECVAW